MKTKKLEEIKQKYSFTYINPKFVLELWQEGEDFARKVIYLYIDSVSEIVTNCHKTIVKQDIEALDFIIHQNKPNLIQLEATYLLSLLEKLRLILKKQEQSLGMIYKVFNEIEIIISHIKNELKNCL